MVVVVAAAAAEVEEEEEELRTLWMLSKSSFLPHPSLHPLDGCGHPGSTRWSPDFQFDSMVVGMPFQFDSLVTGFSMSISIHL